MTEIAATVIGPNGVQTLEVHAAGCADLNRPKYRRSERSDQTITSLEALTWSWYQDMIAESDDPENWESYSNEFKIFPCVGHLPRTDADQTPVTKPARKTTRKAAAKQPTTGAWTDEELTYVAAHVDQALADIATALGRTVNSVRHKVRAALAA